MFENTLEAAPILAGQLISYAVAQGGGETASAASPSYAASGIVKGTLELALTLTFIKAPGSMPTKAAAATGNKKAEITRGVATLRA